MYQNFYMGVAGNPTLLVMPCRHLIWTGLQIFLHARLGNLWCEFVNFQQQKFDVRCEWTPVELVYEHDQHVVQCVMYLSTSRWRSGQSGSLHKRLDWVELEIYLKTRSSNSSNVLCFQSTPCKKQQNQSHDVKEYFRKICHTIKSQFSHLVPLEKWTQTKHL